MSLASGANCLAKRQPARCSTKPSRLLYLQATSTKNSVSIKNRASLPDISLSLLEDGARAPELISVELPVSRDIAPTPSAVPIIHSKAYYIQNNQFESEDNKFEPPAVVRKRQGTENLLETALRSFDDQLDEIERNPPPVQKAIFAVSQGPVGQATAQGVQAAAKLTMQATMEAARLAAPVGGWVLKQGAKTAFNWMTYAMSQEKSSTVKIKKKGKAGQSRARR